MPKTVLITGAGSGFGRGAALELARRGHKVVAAVLNDEQAAELARSEPKLTVVKLDITRPQDVAKVDQWDLDVFIANAAIGQTGRSRSFRWSGCARCSRSTCSPPSASRSAWP